LGMSVTNTAEFTEGKRGRALAARLGGPVVPPTALSTAQHDATPTCVGRSAAAGDVRADLTGRQKFRAELLNQSVHSTDLGCGASHCWGTPRHLITHYSMILVTTPAPTVLPPSRMAKRICSSSATVVMSSTSTVTLSPGITIFTPSGSMTEPVTSVVRM